MGTIIRLIADDAGLQTAHNEMKRLHEIGDKTRTPAENDRLGVLSALIRQYEDEHYPLDLPDPIDAIVIRMGELGLQQADLLAEFGNKTRASQMLSRTRALTLPVIRRLAARLALPVSVLAQEYPLASDAAPSLHGASSGSSAIG